jgi:hypothetical protein
MRFIDLKQTNFIKKAFSFKIPLLIAIPLILIAFGIGTALTKFPRSSTVAKAAISDNQTVNSLKLNVNEAQLTKNIKLAQKNANAPAGKSFLILFTEVENSSSSAQIANYGDYFRLDENGKKFAPLAINTNFSIPSQATLEKQLIFVVDEGSKTFNLLLGDINQNQQKNIAINF